MPAIRKTPTQELISRTQSCFDKYMRINSMGIDRIARTMNVTPKTVREWMRCPDRVPIGTMWQLASIIKCPICELCSGESPEEIAVRIMANAARELH